MGELLDGKILSEKMNEETARHLMQLKNRGITPGLAVVLVGDDPASAVYVRNKEKACAAFGIVSRTIHLEATVSQAEVERQIDALNADASVHGILLQLPLPDSLNEKELLYRISPAKDVDGFHPVNCGLLWQGGKCVRPCTPSGIMYMLNQTNIPLQGKHAVIIGRSNIVGKPMAALLLESGCTVTVCHSKTVDLPAITRTADLIVAAVGKPRFVTADMVKPGAAVVDVGINRVEGKLVGDVDFDAVRPIASYITPVPGGVGKMTIAALMRNVVQLAEGSLL